MRERKIRNSRFGGECFSSKRVLILFLSLLLTFCEATASAQTGVDVLPPIVKPSTRTRNRKLADIRSTYPTVKVTKKLFGQLNLIAKFSDDLILKNSIAYLVKLKRSKSPLLVVLVGLGGTCGDYIKVFSKQSDGYKELLEISCVQFLAPNNRFTNGYPDLVYKTGHEPTNISIFKYDGEQYKERECFTKRNSSARKVIRVKCTPD